MATGATVARLLTVNTRHLFGPGPGRAPVRSGASSPNGTRPGAVTGNKPERRDEPRIGQHAERGSLGLIPDHPLRSGAEQHSDDATAAGWSLDGACVAIDEHDRRFLPRRIRVRVKSLTTCRTVDRGTDSVRFQRLRPGQPPTAASRTVDAAVRAPSAAARSTTSR